MELKNYLFGTVCLSMFMIAIRSHGQITLGPNPPDRLLFLNVASSDPNVTGTTVSIEGMSDGSFDDSPNTSLSGSDGSAFASASQNTTLADSSDFLSFYGDAESSASDTSAGANYGGVAQSQSFIQFILDSPAPFTLTASGNFEGTAGVGSMVSLGSQGSGLLYAFGINVDGDAEMDGQSGTVSGVLASGTYDLSMFLGVSTSAPSNPSESASASVNFLLGVPEPSTVPEFVLGGVFIVGALRARNRWFRKSLLP